MDAPVCITLKAKRGPCWWLSGKEKPVKAEDSDSIPDPVRSPGEGSGNTLQDSCLGNSRDRGAWWATAYGVAKESDTTWQLK